MVSVDLDPDSMYTLEGGGLGSAGGEGGGGGPAGEVIVFDDVDGDEDLDDELLQQANVFIPGKDSPNFGQALGFTVGGRRRSSARSSVDEGVGGGMGRHSAAALRRRQHRHQSELSEEEEEEEGEGEDGGNMEQIGEDEGERGDGAKGGSANKTRKNRKRR